MLNVQVTAYGRQTVPDRGVVRSCDPLKIFGAPIISLGRLNLPRHQTEIVTGAHPGARIAYTRAMSEHRCCPKNESKYLYNAFQARDRWDKSECGIQGCHLVFFDF